MGEQGDEWEFERIGTAREKMHVEREIQDLKERLEKVEEWTARRDQIEKELAQVWVEGGESLEAPPAYHDARTGQEEEGEEGKTV